MSYYDTCRAQKRDLYLQGKEARIRAERKKLYFQSIRSDPLQAIRLIGLPVKITQDQQQYEQVETEANLVPWQAKPDVKIDRFDVRAMLDYYVEPEAQPKFAEADADLEVLLNYERYRMIIKSANRGVAEMALLRKVDSQLAIKTAHMDKQFDEDAKPKPQEKKKKKKKDAENIYDAVGFDYGVNEPVANDKASDEEPEDEDDDDEEEEALYEDAQSSRPLTGEEIERLANSYGIAGFSVIQSVDEANELQSKENSEQRRALTEALDETLKKKQKESKPKKRSSATEPAATFDALKHAGGALQDSSDSSDSEDDPEIGKRFFVTSFGATETKQSSQSGSVAKHLKVPSRKSMAQFFPDLQQILPREEAMMSLTGHSNHSSSSHGSNNHGSNHGSNSSSSGSVGDSSSLKRPPGIRSREPSPPPKKAAKPATAQPARKLTAAEKLRERMRGELTRQLSEDQRAEENKHRERELERRNITR